MQAVGYAWRRRRLLARPAMALGLAVNGPLPSWCRPPFLQRLPVTSGRMSDVQPQTAHRHGPTLTPVTTIGRSAACSTAASSSCSCRPSRKLPRSSAFSVRRCSSRRLECRDQGRAREAHACWQHGRAWHVRAAGARPPPGRPCQRALHAVHRPACSSLISVKAPTSACVGPPPHTRARRVR